MKRHIVSASALALLMACGGSSDSPTGPTPPSPPPNPGVDLPSEVFVGAGDIGWCGSEGGPDRTAALLDRLSGTIFTAGDNAYFHGTVEEFQRCYEPSWGRHKARTRPSPGNHEYLTPGAAGYFQYFGANAGPAGLGYYSYNLGAWHIVALNSEASAFPGSPQIEWLRADLISNQRQCTLAYFHTPLFGSGTNGSNPHMLAAWRVLYELGADVVVNGHNHSYERFAKQTPDGALDLTRGIRQFVVGTGGAPLTSFPRLQPNSEVRFSVWGLLKLTLHARRYDWEFVSADPGSGVDTGTTECH